MSPNTSKNGISKEQWAYQLLWLAFGAYIFFGMLKLGFLWALTCTLVFGLLELPLVILMNRFQGQSERELALEDQRFKERLQQEKKAAFRARLQYRVEMDGKMRKRAHPYTQPRYDEVYHQGVEALESE